MTQNGQESRRAEPSLAELLDPALLEARLSEARARRAEAIAKRSVEDRDQRSSRRARVGEVLVSPTPPLPDEALEPIGETMPERAAVPTDPEPVARSSRAAVRPPDEFKPSTLPERLERSGWKSTKVEPSSAAATRQETPERQRPGAATVLLLGFSVGVLGAIAFWAPTLMQGWIQPEARSTDASSSDRTQVALDAPGKRGKLDTLGSKASVRPAIPDAVAERLQKVSHPRGDIPAEPSLPLPWPPVDAAWDLPGDPIAVSTQANAAPEAAVLAAAQPTVEAIPTRDLRVDRVPSPTEIALAPSPGALPARTIPAETSTAPELALANDARPDAPTFAGALSLEAVGVETATPSAAVPSWFGPMDTGARASAAAPSEAELRFASLGDATRLGFPLEASSPSRPRPAGAPAGAKPHRATRARAAAAPATQQTARAVRQVSARPDPGEAARRAVLERTVENMLRDRLLRN